jgi:hypothetical protein
MTQCLSWRRLMLPQLCRCNLPKSRSRGLSVSALALLLAVAVVGSAFAQQNVDTPVSILAERALNDQNEIWLALRVRADALKDRASGIIVPADFCGANLATRASVAAELVAVSDAYHDLQNDYNAFKNLVSKSTSGTDAKSIALVRVYEGMFGQLRMVWPPRDNEIYGVQDILGAKQRAFNAASLAPCPGSITKKGGGGGAIIQGGGTTQPPKVDPLAGLTRPGVPAPPIPPSAGPFCTEAERLAYIAANITPVRFQLSTARDELMSYKYAVTQRLPGYPGPAKKATDPDDIQKLQGEVDWTDHALTTIDALYSKVVGVEASIKVDPSRCPKANSVGGLQRPTWDVPGLTSPSFFCSEAERQKFIDQLTAAIKAANAAQGPVIDYSRQVTERQIALRGGKLVVGGVTLQPDDPAVTKALQAESDWADAQLKRMRDIEDQLVKQRSDTYSIPIKDCSHAKVAGKLGGATIEGYLVGGGTVAIGTGTGTVTSTGTSTGEGDSGSPASSTGSVGGQQSTGFAGVRVRVETNVGAMGTGAPSQGAASSSNGSCGGWDQCAVSQLRVFGELGVQSAFGQTSFSQGFGGLSGAGVGGFGQQTVKENYQFMMLGGVSVPLNLADVATPSLFLDLYGGITIDSWTQTLQGREAAAPAGPGFNVSQNKVTVDPTLGVGLRMKWGDLNGDGVPDLIWGINAEAQFRPGNSVQAQSVNFPGQSYVGTVAPQVNLQMMFRVGMPF